MDGDDGDFDDDDDLIDDDMLDDEQEQDTPTGPKKGPQRTQSIEESHSKRHQSPDLSQKHKRTLRHAATISAPQQDELMAKKDGAYNAKLNQSQRKAKLMAIQDPVE